MNPARRRPRQLYERRPAKVQELLDAGHDPQHGYAATVMRGYPR